MAQTHELENSWSFWEHRKTNARNSDQAYGSNMFEIGAFSTVEDFWKFKNNLPQPSEIFHTNEGPRMKFADREIEGYSLFKAGIRPEWEDKLNKSGGELFCRKSFEPRDLDEVYETLLLGMIGETIDPDDKLRETLQVNVKDCLRRTIFTEYRPH